MFGEHCSMTLFLSLFGRHLWVISLSRGSIRNRIFNLKASGCILGIEIKSNICKKQVQMNNLDPLVSTGPSQSHSPRLNRRDTINVRKLGIVTNSITNI